MDLLRWLRSWLPSEREGAVPLVRFDTPESAEEHGDLVRELAQLAGLDLEVRSTSRRTGVTVTLGIGTRRRTIVHPKNALDLERTLSALEALRPEDASRRYYQIERRSLARDHAVAFATRDEVHRLIERGWSVVRETEASAELSIVEGVRVRGKVERWDDGSPKKIVLAEDADLCGVRCAADTVVRFVDDGVCEATLAAEKVLTDCTLPPRTRVYFHYHSPVIGLARIASSIEVAGLHLPAHSELELDERGRLVAVTLGAATTPPAGYRDRASIEEGAVLELTLGKWRVADVERTSRTGQARPSRRKDSSTGALFGWTLLFAFVGAPFALLASLSWLSSKSAGERCERDGECHSVLGDRCVYGVCAPHCESDADCSVGWSCERVPGSAPACFPLLPTSR